MGGIKIVLMRKWSIQEGLYTWWHEFIIADFFQLPGIRFESR